MFEIKKGSGCFYIGESEENPLAEMTYVRSGRKVIIDHTYVPPEMGGQGVGKLLLKELVDMVRAEGKKIVPA